MAKKSTANKLETTPLPVVVAEKVEVKTAVVIEIPTPINNAKEEKAKIDLDFDNSMSSTDVYDDGDIASALEMGFIAQALQRHKEKVAPEKHPDFNGINCVDCWVDIPQIRLDMGKVRCVHCQSALEKTNKLYGRK